jgi:hypothetical protein
MTKAKTEKPWGWSYITEGVPSDITYRGETFLRLDDKAKSQLRNVRRILRVLNSSKVNP